MHYWPYDACAVERTLRFARLNRCTTTAAHPGRRAAAVTRRSPAVVTSTRVECRPVPTLDPMLSLAANVPPRFRCHSYASSARARPSGGAAVW